jgi:hypothetical protein
MHPNNEKSIIDNVQNQKIDNVQNQKIDNVKNQKIDNVQNQKIDNVQKIQNQKIDNVPTLLGRYHKLGYVSPPGANDCRIPECRKSECRNFRTVEVESYPNDASAQNSYYMEESLLRC